jgi:hypothetical protein
MHHTGGTASRRPWSVSGFGFSATFKLATAGVRGRRRRGQRREGQAGSPFAPAGRLECCSGSATLEKPGERRRRATTSVCGSARQAQQYPLPSTTCVLLVYVGVRIRRSAGELRLHSVARTKQRERGTIGDSTAGPTLRPLCVKCTFLPKQIDSASIVKGTKAQNLLYPLDKALSHAPGPPARATAAFSPGLSIRRDEPAVNGQQGRRTPSEPTLGTVTTVVWRYIARIASPAIRASGELHGG